MMTKMLSRETKLSKNFRVKEFTLSDVASKNIGIRRGGHVQWLLETLVKNIMQPLRSDLGRIVISNGLRDIEVWQALKANGYNPSKTTDHSYGDCELNRHGVGACDFYMYFVRHCDWPLLMWQAYEKIRRFMNYGQVIIYLEKKTLGCIPRFIHVSNPPELVHSATMIKRLNRWKTKSIIKIGRNVGGYFPWTKSMEKELRAG